MGIYNCKCDLSCIQDIDVRTSYNLTSIHNSTALNERKKFNDFKPVRTMKDTNSKNNNSYGEFVRKVTVIQSYWRMYTIKKQYKAFLMTRLKLTDYDLVEKENFKFLKRKFKHLQQLAVNESLQSKSSNFRLSALSEILNR